MAAERTTRVLMTADTVGGVWTYATGLAAALASDRVQVDLATMGGGVRAAQRAQLSGIPGLNMHESEYRLEWMQDPWEDVDRAGEWLLELEAELKPDVVHLNQFAFGALPFKAPKMVVAHSCVLSWWRAVRGGAAPPEWNTYLHRVAQGLRGADLVVAPSASMLRSLEANYGTGFPKEVIPNGCDALRYTPGRKESLIFAAGRLWDEAKNLAALEAVAPFLPWPILVAGSCTAPDGKTVEPRAAHALGELPPAEIASHMSRAAIYAMPARYEPFGLSILEAGLSGCALVLGDIESLREIWGDAALFVPPEDHEALRDTLAMLIADPSQCARLGRAARRRAVSYDAVRMGRAYFTAYTALQQTREEEHSCT